MNLAQIEEQLQKMLLLGVLDKAQQILAWEICVSTTSFWRQIHSDVYINDPMSKDAPPECYRDHMRDWDRFLCHAETELENSVDEYHKEQKEALVDYSDIDPDYPF